ncbi:dihydropteroate synthase [Thalassobaculum fulvum]|uniref:dihydropteroate synthase n=1 Tax=Thalassobaculum fulvum TaxID=1633335 RepID=A0A918XXN1_9PROT|nr:dihydropteroate synthase [Thalassobaculum fulvum]GHD63468.1 dihydropteroate synthase [Thalassobaculum fulvum]
MIGIERKPAPSRGLLHSGGRLYLLPRDLLTGGDAAAAVADGSARPLAGGPAAFRAVDLVVRSAASATLTRVSLPDLADLDIPDLPARLERLTARRPLADAAAGPLLMGIVNTTPDSFYDGGRHPGPGAAVEHGMRLAEEGAAILDVGGESTRPGADPVPMDEEIRRTEPVVRALAAAGHRVSIDSRNAPVMAAALDAGAAWVNDVSGLAHDPGAAALVAGRGCPVVLMHMRRDPKTMQVEPRYDCAPLDVYDELEARLMAAVGAGIARDRILLDPGYGFAKSVRHNLEVTAWLALLHGLGCPILFGASRKSSIAALSRGEPAGERLPGSLALGLAAAARGAQVLRVHDVAETAQALAVQRALDAVDR